MLRFHREQPFGGSYYNRGCEGSGAAPSEERVTYDGDVLDEIVIYDANVHLEALGTHGYYLHIDRGDLRIFIDLSDPLVTEITGIDLTVGPDLLGCQFAWYGQRQHRCGRRDKDHGGSHLCECGARKRQP